jgi:nucleoside-diphosphate-sugar epimerase
MKTVMITGGSGNVGRFVVAELAKTWHVVNFDQRPQRPRQKSELREGDILSVDDLRAGMKGVDAIVHLAAVPTLGAGTPDQIIEVNVLGTHRVLETAAQAGIKRVVIASSDSTFGFVFGTGAERPEYLPLDEGHPTRPADAYGLSKLLGEEICAAHARRFGMTTVALRYCWVWFPPDYPPIDALIANDENCRRTMAGYVDARDVGQAVRRSIEADLRGHETFMISAADTYLREPTLDFIARHFPDLPTLRKPVAMMGNPHVALFDCTKARTILGYKPRYTWRKKS